MSFFKKNKIFISVFIFTFIFFTYWYLHNQRITPLEIYGDYKYIITVLNSKDLIAANDIRDALCSIENFCDLDKLSFFNFYLSRIQLLHKNINMLDNSIIFGTRYYQLVLPFVGSIAGLVAYDRFSTIYNYTYTRYQSSYLKTTLKKISSINLKNGLAVYFAYILFFITVVILNKGVHINTDEGFMETARYIFSDWWGVLFYYDHTVLYYIIEGFLRFFLMVLAYSVFSSGIALYFEDKKLAFFAPILYYFGFSGVFGLILNHSVFAVYLTPSIIMSSGDYTNFSTLLLILVNMIPMAVGLTLIIFKGLKNER